ncbi:MAG: hypothetical protein ACE10G_06580, partial [Gemmatimonadales bacterium]
GVVFGLHRFAPIRLRDVGQYSCDSLVTAVFPPLDECLRRYGWNWETQEKLNIERVTESSRPLK